MPSSEDITSFVQGRTMAPEIEWAIAKEYVDPTSDVSGLCEQSLRSIHAVLEASEGRELAYAKKRLVTRQRVAAVLAGAKAFDQALALKKEIYQEACHALGETHVDTLSCLDGVGMFEFEAQDYGAAKRTFQRVLALRRQLPEDDPTYVAHTLMRLARVCEVEHDYHVAIGHHREAVAIFESKLGPDHLETGVSLNDLGCALLAIDQLTEAKQCLERALKIYAKLGEDESVDSVLYNLGIIEGLE